MGRDRNSINDPGWDDEPEWLKEPAEEEPGRVPTWSDTPPSQEWERIREGYVPADSYDPEDEKYLPDTKPRGGSSAWLIAVIVILIAGMAFAGWQLGSILLNYRRDRTAYSDLAEKAISELPVSTPAAAEDEPADEGPSVAEIKVSQVPISVDWDYLLSENPDIVGWIYCPGTIINYPVVQNADNEYYLKHGFNKESNVAGAIFADNGSVIGTTNSNLVIYGHNMKDKSMFAILQSYAEESFCDENPTWYLLTPNGSYRIELFAAHIKEGTSNNFPTVFSSAVEYQIYIDTVSSSFFWYKSGIFKTDYQLITLSTCAYVSGYTDPRYLVQGVMIPIE